MSKSIHVYEECVITKDDKGNFSLVGKAKEALTSLQKHKVSVHIILCDDKKEDVEKFLTGNNVPFASILAKDEVSTEDNGKKNNTPICVVPSSKFIALDDSWNRCLDRIVQRLWGKNENKSPKSEQQRMDDSMADYIRWATPQKSTKDTSGASLAD